MAIVTIDEAYLEDMANAIREKKDCVDRFKPRNMANEIRSIETKDPNAYEDEGIYYIHPNSTRIGGYSLKRFYYGNENKYYGVKIREVRPIYLTAYNKGGYKGTSSELTYVGRGAFANQPELTLIDLPGSITELGNYAFGGAPNLHTLILRSELGPDEYLLSDSAIQYTLITPNAAQDYDNKHNELGSDIYLIQPDIYVPRSVVDKWKNWIINNISPYSMALDHIFAIEDYPELSTMYKDYKKVYPELA